MQHKGAQKRSCTQFLDLSRRGTETANRMREGGYTAKPLDICAIEGRRRVLAAQRFAGLNAYDK